MTAEGGAEGRGASGRFGEAAAVILLERSGYRIVDTNVHFARSSGLAGEIDIVAFEGQTLCFVEVKTRRGTPGSVFPGEAVTPAKQRQIARLALAYLTRAGLLAEDAGMSIRFDVVTVVLSPGDPPRVRRVELWRGAFLSEESEG